MKKEKKIQDERISLRLQTILKQAAETAAAKQGRSVNGYILNLIRQDTKTK